MSLVEGIAAFSTARSLAEVQFAVAAKVLKIAQGQNQTAADLVSAATENLEEVIKDFATDLGASPDAYA